MRKAMVMLGITLITTVILTSCNHSSLSNHGTSENMNSESSANLGTLTQSPSESMPSSGADTGKASLPDTVMESYYIGQTEPAFEYFQKSRIQRFLAMWVEEEIKDIANPQWNYDTFTRISILDHDFTVSRPDEAIYGCAFSDGAGRYGYIIVKYDEAGPAMGNLGVTETTPYLYDLKANIGKIAAGLLETDIDISTAKASRVYLLDKEKNRADQAIRFTDDKGDNYICYLVSPSFEIVKWRTL